MLISPTNRGFKSHRPPTTFEISESRKANLTEDPARFYVYKHLPFNKPIYRRMEKVGLARNVEAYVMYL